MSDSVFRPVGPENIRSRRRKIKAILAGGLVLAGGVAATLAAWNDSEFAQGTFSAGTFDLQGSIDGTTFQSHPAGTPAALVLSLNSTTLSPGDSVHAPFAVHLATGTTNAGSVTVVPSTSTGTLTGLTYALVQPSTFGCTAGTSGTTLIPSATAMNSGSGAFSAPVATSTAPGAPVFLCFTVTAGPGLTQGQSATVTWNFTATSA